MTSFCLVTGRGWGGHRIAVCLEDGDLGTVLGEGKRYRDADLARARPDDWEFIAASIAAGKTPGVRRDREGYIWESLRAAKQALRAVRAAARAEKPWPEWAVQARAAGWTPPRRWKP